MASFDDLKQKALDAMETIADVSVEVYKIAEEKAKTLARQTKLNADIAREKSAIRKLYSEIGKKYYELHKDAPEDELSTFCADITAAFENIDEKRAELEALKVQDEVDVEIDFDEDDADIEVEIEVTDDKSDGGDSTP